MKHYAPAERNRILRNMKNAQKEGTAKRIPHAGVYLNAKVVRQHRYRSEHGLPYSESVARVTLNGGVHADNR